MHATDAAPAGHGGFLRDAAEESRAASGAEGSGARRRGPRDEGRGAGHRRRRGPVRLQSRRSAPEETRASLRSGSETPSPVPRGGVGR